MMLQSYDFLMEKELLWNKGLSFLDYNFYNVKKLIPFLYLDNYEIERKELYPLFQKNKYSLYQENNTKVLSLSSIHISPSFLKKRIEKESVLSMRINPSEDILKFVGLNYDLIIINPYTQYFKFKDFIKSIEEEFQTSEIIRFSFTHFDVEDHYLCYDLYSSDYQLDKIKDMVKDRNILIIENQSLFSTLSLTSYEVYNQFKPKSMNVLKMANYDIRDELSSLL